MWSSRNSHSLLVGMQDGAATLKDSLAGSYKTEPTPTIGSSRRVPCYLPEELETFVLTKACTQMFISSFTHSRQNLEATKMSALQVHGEVNCDNTQIMGYYSALKRNEPWLVGLGG